MSTSRVRIPNEGEKITHHPPVGAEVRLAVRERHGKLNSTKQDDEPRFQAELRHLVGDAWLTCYRTTKTTREAVIAGAMTWAQRQGWTVHDKRLGWNVRDESYERAVREDAADMVANKVTAGKGPAMKLRIRLNNAPPIEIDDAWQVTLEIKGKEYEVIPQLVDKDEPANVLLRAMTLGDKLVVVPHGENSIVFGSRR